MDKNQIIQQIDYVLTKWDALRQNSQHDDLSDLPAAHLAELVTTMADTIVRLAPTGSQFQEAAKTVLKTYTPSKLYMAHPRLLGILRSLKDSYMQGYLENVQELIHADLFSDFLEMAQYLLNEGYKDPAAVMISGVLEEHLRKLCMKNNIPIIDSKGQPRKASALNDDLAKCVYDKLEQKGITFWLDLRNKSAHGHYTEYDQSQVENMLQGVQSFLVRYKA
jgi:hypothetical protein